MKKMLLSSMVVMLCGMWAAAQSYPSSSSQTPQSSQPSASSQATPTSGGSQTTVEGCVSGSDGNFMLTDKSGTMYSLTGDTSKLSEHVGHEVQITGMTSQPAAAPSESASSQSAQQSLKVSSIKHVATTCSNNPSSGAKSTPPPKQ